MQKSPMSISNQTGVAISDCIWEVKEKMLKMSGQIEYDAAGAGAELIISLPLGCDMDVEMLLGGSNDGNKKASRLGSFQMYKDGVGFYEGSVLFNSVRSVKLAVGGGIIQSSSMAANDSIKLSLEAILVR